MPSFTGLILSALVGMSVSAQQSEIRGSVERIKVHGKSLEGNLGGDSPDREVAIYLPPSYKASPNPRYPVVYLLHGFTDNVENWWGQKPHFVNVPTAAEKAIAAGGKEMIVVMPDAFTRLEGSMYSSSLVTGNWEEYLTKDLVAYIDSHYRTIPQASGRGLAGHSMGGYGALRIGMKSTGVFSSVYLLSPCCLETGTPRPDPKTEAVKAPEEVANLDFYTKVTLASAAAWSPNPKNPPLFVDLPSKSGKVQAGIVAKWHANAPLAQIDQYIFNLRRLKAIGMDAGRSDQPIGSTVEKLHGILNDYGVPHVFEIYDGDHLNRIAERLEKNVWAFFATNLQ